MIAAFCDHLGEQKLMEANRITSARVVASHTLELHFGDGLVGRIDLKPALWGTVFEPLLDESYFAQFRLEDDTVRWPNDADFCPDVLRYWCEVGGVRTQAETDAHFAGRTVTSF
jgi:hypothetical protein